MSNQKEIQEFVNEELWQICDELKRITDIKLNYIEYLSALLCIKYFPDIGIREFNQNYDIYNIDTDIENIRRHTNLVRLFSNIRFSHIMNEDNLNILKNVIESLSCMINDLEKNTQNSKKIIAEAYQYVIMKASYKNEIQSKNGEFYTPKQVIKTMVNLLDIKSKGIIHDPACGTGDFLVEAAKQSDSSVYGKEDDIGKYNIYITNLILHDIKLEKFEKYKGFNNVEKANFILGNPPFSDNIVRKNDYENSRYGRYIPSKTTGYSLYLVNALERLDDYGRMALILPHGILFRETEKRLREMLISENLIDAIIGLPENLFPSTRIPVIILIIKKNRPNEDIMIIDASREYIKNRQYNILDEKSMDKIIDIYNKRIEVENYSHLANKEEIEYNEYNLNIKRYVRIKQKRKEFNMIEMEESIVKLEHERRDIQERIQEILKNCKL